MFDNIKRLELIRASLKIVEIYMNQLHLYLDHDFRKLTKLVSPFLDSYTFRY
jgi:hypothetical protein